MAAFKVASVGWLSARRGSARVGFVIHHRSHPLLILQCFSPFLFFLSFFYFFLSYFLFFV